MLVRAAPTGIRKSRGQAVGSTSPLRLRRSRQLTLGGPRRTGRSNTGGVSCWSKGRAAVRRRPARFGFNASKAGLHALCMVRGFLRTPRHGLQAAHLVNAWGAECYIPRTSTLSPYDFVAEHVPAQAPLLGVLVRDSWPIRLERVRPGAKISTVGVGWAGPGQAAVSPGSVAWVLYPVFVEDRALLLLPSGLPALAAAAQVVFRGPCRGSRLRVWSVGSAGRARRLGRSPKPRGTVMNAGDHPHGGQARSIRYPRTPWGLTAKQPRRPDPTAGLRPLKKRRKAAADGPAALACGADRAAPPLPPPNYTARWWHAPAYPPSGARPRLAGLGMLSAGGCRRPPRPAGPAQGPVGPPPP